MNSIRIAAICCAVCLCFAACEKPKPKGPPTPEHQACIDKVNAWADCMVKEASQLDSGSAGKIERAMKTNRNKAEASMESCQAVVGRMKPDDGCS